MDSKLEITSAMNRVNQHFTLKNKSVNGQQTIYHVIRINKGKRKCYRIGRIYPKHWDKTKQLVKKSCGEAESLNAIISNKKALVQRIVALYNIQDQVLTEAKLIELYENNGAKGSFTDYMYNTIIRREHDISDGTFWMQMSVWNKFKRFKETVEFSDLTYKLIKDFDNYLIELGNQINTRYQNHKVIRTYINFAIEKDDYQFKNPYKKFKAQRKATLPVYLNRSELNKMELYFESDECKGTEKNVLQRFLFNCFTGPRCSDLAKLSRENLVDGFLHYEQQKTKNWSNKPVIIQLGEYALKYSNESGPLLPKAISPQKEREYLKRICRKLHIDKNVTLHSARHTFGFLLAMADVPMQKIQNMLGHRKTTMTLRYVHLADDYSKDPISKLDAFMKQPSKDSPQDLALPQLRVIR